MADRPSDSQELVEEGLQATDVSFRRHLWAAFAIFALLLIGSLAVITNLYLGAVRDKAWSEAVEKGQESADEMALIVQEEVERQQSDLYTIVRDRREVDAVADRVTRRQIVESWQIVDATGKTIASSTRVEQGGVPPSGEPPTQTRETLTVERDLLLDGQKAGLVRLFLSEPNLMREVEEFQSDVRRRVVYGAGVTLALLLGGFLYVIRLLERTNRIHHQAETRLRLASLGSLAGGLAHEIRNPLNAMNMNIQLLEEDIAAQGLDSDRQWRDTLQSTRREIRRLDDLVTNVLTYSRPFTPNRTPTPLQPLLSDLVQFLSPELAERSSRTTLRVTPDDLGLQVDAGRLRQALLNVVRNASQAIAARGGGGTIAIEAAEDQGFVRIDVIDDGPGIPESERSRIFEAFRATDSGGTGIGLPLARKIVRAHGGELTIHPVPTGGTRVEFLLPTTGTGRDLEPT